MKEGSDRHLRLAQAGGVEKEKGIARHGDALLLEFQSTLDFYVQIVNRPLNGRHG
ncbi:pyrroloquinoline quinone (PQQ) biosynthesis protein C [Pseudomonas otitidis]|nr:pyrroloquinoline quinone (PQQ) biosynthesis protein C [Pseudomonas otitidis]